MSPLVHLSHFQTWSFRSPKPMPADGSSLCWLSSLSLRCWALRSSLPLGTDLWAASHLRSLTRHALRGGCSSVLGSAFERKHNVLAGLYSDNSSWPHGKLLRQGVGTPSTRVEGRSWSPIAPHHGSARCPSLSLSVVHTCTQAITDLIYWDVK